MLFSRAKLVPLLATALAALSLIDAGCRRTNPGLSHASGRASLRVVVSIAPLRALVEPLIRAVDGDKSDISLLIPIGASEHGYEIPPRMIAAIVRADLVVYNGMGIEPHIARILAENPNPSRDVVCFAEIVGATGAEPPEPPDTEDHADHDHDHGPDPHLWLDPVLVEALVPHLHAAVERAALRTAPAAEAASTRSAISAAAETLSSQVRAVDEAYRKSLGSLPNRVIITAHAAWGRLAARYGLEQVALGGLEASEASPAAIAHAVEMIRAHNAASIFTEPQISPALANRLAAQTGASVYSLDPLGDGDWFAMMHRNLDSLITGLSKVSPAPAAGATPAR